MSLVVVYISIIFQMETEDWSNLESSRYQNNYNYFFTSFISPLQSGILNILLTLFPERPGDLLTAVENKPA